jgi:hypothetical protein
VSQDGAGFLASSPVEETQMVQFEISARSTRGPEAIGQLMWKDSGGKRGGLQFTNAPEELREIIRPFLPNRQSLEPQPEIAEQIAQQFAAERPKILGRDDILNLSQFEERAPRFRQANSRRNWTAFANAVTATLACLIALAIWYAVNDSIHRREARASFSHLKGPVSIFFAKQINRWPHWLTAPKRSAQTAEDFIKAFAVRSAGLNAPLQVAPPIVQPAAEVEAIARLRAPTLPPMAPQKIGALIKPPQDHASARSASAPSQTVDTIQTHGPNQTQLALVRKLLQEDTDPSNPPKAVQILWQAVGKGNAAAEIELAEVYLSGQGVPKSCSQALILLTAARNHKNSLAEQKLRSLPQYGCDPVGEQAPPASRKPPGTPDAAQ